MHLSRFNLDGAVAYSVVVVLILFKNALLDKFIHLQILYYYVLHDLVQESYAIDR